MIWFITLYLLPVFITIWALLKDSVSDITLHELLCAVVLVFTPVINLVLAWSVLWMWRDEINWNKVIIKRRAK
jgi:hypothetical protein